MCPSKTPEIINCFCREQKKNVRCSCLPEKASVTQDGPMCPSETPEIINCFCREQKKNVRCSCLPEKASVTQGFARRISRRCFPVIVTIRFQWNTLPGESSPNRNILQNGYKTIVNGKRWCYNKKIKKASERKSYL